MLEYLSLDIICFTQLTVFLELRSLKTGRCSEQIMSADKYPSIFSRQMDAIVYLFVILPLFILRDFQTQVLRMVRVVYWEWRFAIWSVDLAIFLPVHRARHPSCTTLDIIYMCEHTGALAIRNNAWSVNAPKEFRLKGWFSLATESESELQWSET